MVIIIPLFHSLQANTAWFIVVVIIIIIIIIKYKQKSEFSWCLTF